MAVSFDEIIKKMHDVGALHVEQNLRFPLEPLANRGVSLNREFFEDDHAAKRGVNCLVHRPHAAFRDKPHDFVFSDIFRR